MRPDEWTNPKKKSKGRRWREQRKTRLGLSGHGPVCRRAGQPAHGSERAGKPNHLTLAGQLYNLGVSCLIDTGSTDSIVSSETFQRIPTEQRPQLTEEKGEYTGVDGRRLRIWGRMDVPLVFGHVKVWQSLLVADIDGEVLLGMDFLMNHQCSLDLKRGLVRVGKEELRCWDQNEDRAHFRVTTEAQVELQPHESRTIVARVQRTGEVTQWGLIEPSVQLSDNPKVMVGRTLVSTAQDGVPVRVHNGSDEKAVIRADQLLGWCESVESCTAAGQSSRKGPKKVRSMHKPHLRSRDADVPAHLVDLYQRSSIHLQSHQKAQLRQVLIEYQHVFAKSKGDRGQTGIVKHGIDTGSARPIKQPPRRLPFAKREIEREEIAKMEAGGVIRPSTSPWAAPVVLVKKKDGSMRFCIDYRLLNDVTVKDAYPLPRIDDCLDSLGGALWFSTMDLNAGYWQVEMEEESKAKTAFATRSGLYEFNVMPFGLACAPSTFERLMEEVMRGMQWEECLIYLDDIISFGKDFNQELQRVVRILKRLQAANLKLNPKKCHLFQKQVEFLGHTVSAEGVHASDDKVRAVREWPVPQNVSEVRSFLGLCSYYRKFIKDFAQTARPINALVKKNSTFRWTEECQTAFEALKDTLTEAPVLAYPDVEKTFILDTDASKGAVGAVLSQVHDGVERPVAYYSKTLNIHEQRYCITRKEMVAVVYATRKFKAYLWGQSVKLRTDNAAVSFMLHLKEPEGQLARWVEELSAYDLQLEHRAGRSHNNADAMSRRPCKQCGRLEGSLGPSGVLDLPEDADEQSQRQEVPEEDPGVGTCTAVTRRQRAERERVAPPHAWLEGWDNLEVRDSQLRDREIGPIMDALDKGSPKPNWSAISGGPQALKTLWGQWDRLSVRDGVLYRRWEDDSGDSVRWQVVVPTEKRQEVLEQMHDSPAAGHMGVHRTVDRVRQSFFWAGVRRDVRQHCRRCDSCTAMKKRKEAPKVPMKQIQTGARDERLAVDITGPFTQTKSGNKYVVVIGDYFTKWSEAYAIPNQEAKTVAKAIAERWACTWGAPRFLHSDQGRNFESDLFKRVMDLLGVKKTRTTALHAQGNGMIERFNRTLAHMLSIYAHDHPDEWDGHLCFASMAYNSSVHSTTGFTPYKLRMAEEMRLPMQALIPDPRDEPEDDELEYRDYVDELKSKLRKAHEVARQVTKKQMKVYKDRYDVKATPRQLEVGQAVWLYRPYRKKGVCPKLQSKWDRVYVVTGKLDDVLYRVQKGKTGKAQVVHIQRLMRYEGPDQPTWWKAPNPRQ